MNAAIQKPHPATGDWMKFYIGRLAGEEVSWMRDHLAACDFCWERFLSLGEQSLRLTPPEVADHPVRSCPDDETLAAAAEGALEGPALALFERHLEACERCGPALDELRAHIGAGGDAGRSDTEDGAVAASLAGRAFELLRFGSRVLLGLFRIEESETLRTLAYLRRRNNRLERVLRLWREYGGTLSPFLAFRDETTPREHLRHHALIAREMGPLYAANPGDHYLFLALSEMTSFLSRISSPDMVRGLPLRERYSLYDRWHEIYLALIRLQGMRTLGAPIRTWGWEGYHEPWIRRTGTDS
jgi:hypothetical protein